MRKLFFVKRNVNEPTGASNWIEMNRFYERAGFVRITSDALPVPYFCSDRDSILYTLTL